MMKDQEGDTTSNQSLPGDSDQNGNCVDIKQYLWSTTGDLTSLSSTMSIFLVAYSLIIILGITGNSLVIASVFRHKSLQSVRNIFIVSLSFSDIVVSIVSGTITPISAFSKVWLFGDALCKFLPLLQGSSLCFSTLTLTAISIDRFILIIYPTKRSIQSKHAISWIVINYIIASAISFPMFLQQKLVDYENFCNQFCTEVWGDNLARSMYGTIVFILQFILPVLIITFCYSMISIKLSKGMLVKGHRDEQTQKLTAKSDQRKAALKRRMRTNRMLVSMVLVFLICWSPSVAFNFLRDYDWLPDVVKAQEYLFGLLTHLISISSTVWNPILYCFGNEQFRLAFSEYFRPCRENRSKSKLICQSTNPDTESAASIAQTKKARLNRQLGERCSSVINGVIFEAKERNPSHIIRNNHEVSMPSRTTRLSSGARFDEEHKYNRDSADLAFTLIDNFLEENDETEDSKI